MGPCLQQASSGRHSTEIGKKNNEVGGLKTKMFRKISLKVNEITGLIEVRESVFSAAHFNVHCCAHAT